MQQIPLRVTIANPTTGQEMVVRGEFVVGTAAPTECEGGHGRVRTFLTIDDGDAALDWCLVCVAEQMTDGRLTSLVVTA